MLGLTQHPADPSPARAARCKPAVEFALKR